MNLSEIGQHTAQQFIMRSKFCDIIGIWTNCKIASRFIQVSVLGNYDGLFSRSKSFCIIEYKQHYCDAHNYNATSTKLSAKVM